MTATPDSPPADAADHAAFAALRAAYRDVVSTIEKMTDNQIAFEAAERLGEFLRMAADEAFAMRAHKAEDILNAEKLSLSSLAQRIGVSKARANQLIQSARKDRQ